MMDKLHHYSRILLLPLLQLLVCSTQAMITDSIFNKVNEGQSVIGKIGAEVTEKTNILCALMCLSTEKCKFYKYGRTGQGNCFVIFTNSTTADGEIFETDGNSLLYERNSGRIWTPPSGWTGPNAALYRSFDNSVGLIFMEGTQQRNTIPIIPGQVNHAWTLNSTKSQWIDLGIHTEVCLTRPDTCGAAGGAISLWMKLIDCPDSGGVLSARSGGKAGSHIHCKSSVVRFGVKLKDGIFQAIISTPSGWSHCVLNYIGPNDGDGIKVYYDGAEVESDTNKNESPSPAGDGRVVVGRRYTDQDKGYASVKVDELIFFNQALTNEEVDLIYNSILIVISPKL